MIDFQADHAAAGSDFGQAPQMTFNALVDKQSPEFVSLDDMRRLNEDLLKQFELTDEVLMRWHLSGYIL